MGLEDIFGKEIRGARQLGEDYQDLVNRNDLDYVPGGGHFIILSNKRLSEDADHRKMGTPPWPGIKIHSPLSVEMYNVLKSDDFIQMLKNGEIDGIKVYLYDDSHTKHKEVTIYMSLYSMPNLGKLLNILENKGISIQPVISSYNDIVYLNRMHIAPNAGIFARYSTDFTGKMNISDIENIKDSMMANIDIKDINQVKMIQDYIIGNYMDKIDDQMWRDAADISHPYIVAVSRSWLSKNKENLDYLLRDTSAIYTFITLKRIDRETIVPNPNIILSYDDYNKKLEAYNVLDARIVDDLSIEDTRISDHPEGDLYNFLKYGTADLQQNNIF